MKLATLFNIGHEADLSEYDSTVTDGGRLSQGSPGLASTSGRMEALISTTVAIYGQINFSTPASNELRFRFYIDPNGLTMGDAEAFQLIVYVGSSGPKPYLRYTIAGGYAIAMYYYNDGGYFGAVSINIADAEHYVEVHWERASGESADDGRFRVWVDGVLEDTQSSVDTFTDFDMTGMQMGAAGSLDAGTSGTLYLDEFTANDDGTEIGPVAAPSGAMPMAMHHYRRFRAAPQGRHERKLWAPPAGLWIPPAPGGLQCSV